MATNDFIRGIPFLGDVAGSFGMRTTAEKQKQAALEKVLTDLQQYRPEMIETRQNALDNAMKLFEPTNRWLTKAYGPGAAMDLQGATQSPFSDQAMANMRTAAAKPAQDKIARDAEVKKRQEWHKNKGGRIFGF